MAAPITGTATSIAALRAALFAGCTANGWSADGNILYKGTCQLEIDVSGNHIRIRGGTGRGAGVLTGAAGFWAYLGTANQANAATVLNIGPTTNYELYIFSDPDEVYLICTGDSVRYQYLAFGQSDVPGLPGNGTWFQATMNSYAALTLNSVTPLSIVAGYSSLGNNGDSNCWPMFMEPISNNNSMNCAIHHDYDGVGWTNGRGSGNRSQWGTAGQIAWLKFQDPLLERQPSAINEGAVLLPMDVYAGRPTSNISLCLRPRNVRALRIDNYDPGQIITHGPDSWKVYPWVRKDTVNRINTTGLDVGHTGTLGWAVRYEGP